MQPAFPAAALARFLTEKENPGLYLHIPFCSHKCAYCDFYSVFPGEKMLDDYTAALIREIKQWGGNFHRPIDTVYLGGGTPSLLKERLVPLLDAVRENFSVCKDAEITLEMNPDNDTERLLGFARTAGVNRLSIGAQSGNDEMLKTLGRKHTAADTRKAVATARKAGFSNLSLDFMLGLPGSDPESLQHDLDFIASLSPEHISAYLLKIEPKTAFAAREKTLAFPDEDSTAAQYLAMCEFFEKLGYAHYEISNFCLPGKQSRHNTKYWQVAEYLGIGPAAHSFLDGKRFYYPRDIKAFLAGNTPLPDGEGGTPQEHILLKLRLQEGISFAEMEALYGTLPDSLLPLCNRLRSGGLLQSNKTGISLSDRGMLVSNSIITEILECLE